MEWLEEDEVPVSLLPEWASGGGQAFDGRPYDVTVLPEGMVLTRGRVASALRWEDVLVPIRLDGPPRLLVAAARRPPRTPWFELGGRHVDAIECVLRERFDALAHAGYRERPLARDPVPPDLVLTRVLEHEPLPGAVEIPFPSPSSLPAVVAGAFTGAFALSVFGVMLGPLEVVATMGALGGASLVGSLEMMRRNMPHRVLVLTPDAFVGGLDGASVRAVPWFRVSRFAEGVDVRTGERALEVFGPAGELIARTAARFFAEPVDVIVAIAEAYRQRATFELA